MPDGINYDAFSEALNDKADRDLQNVDTVSGGDAVIAFQRPTAENGYTWFRKYASGWVEQGGYIPANTGTSGTITLSVEMANTSYTVVSNTGNNGANNFFNVDTMNMTTTTMNWYKSAAGLAGSWQVSGMAAQ